MTHRQNFCSLVMAACLAIASQPICAAETLEQRVSAAVALLSGAAFLLSIHNGLKLRDRRLAKKLGA